ncbi:hypothetical protein [Pseudomonas mosselii]|uniref:hypothetical protein n=1 Tax=Pseudomonas mosselii TaxID=78327 RepID=UPI001F3392FF|nr:hypothetical protein [Pseudomonas mosselii]
MVDFFGNGLCIHCHLARNELIEFLAFNDQTEEAWRAKNVNLQEELGELLKKYPEDKHEDIVDSYAWDLHLNQSKYPALHRASLLITLFSFLEHQLNSLAEIMYESVGGDLKLNDINGRGIERAFLFLSKVAGVDLSSFGGEIPFIKGVNLVRNVVVHSGGVLPSDPQAKVHKFISQTAGLSGVETGYVSIHSDFIPKFISLLIVFFERLDLEIEKHIRNYRPKSE